ncbi:MAG: sodium:alanine symporter family protein [Clostridia bacterium]|nr:sodium:alanine symporter family protein [Clostridia bacterium]
MEVVLQVIQTINSYLTDYALLFILVGVGVFFTIRTRFVQVRCFGEGMKNVFGKIKLRDKSKKSGMSSFQALTTAIAAQVGTGNIIGASGAILIGGPGAIFWMWVIAFFGMATIYAEAVLAQKTKVVNEDGSVAGGPVYYIKKAFKGKFGKFLAGFFSVAIVLALGFMGSMVQSNSISEAVSSATTIPTWVIGVVVAVLCALIFIGGINRLASVTEKLVPIMTVVYLLGGLVIVFANITVLPEAIGMIFKYAFMPNAIIGGSIGYAIKTAISQGAKRGLFSNEAGMGSTPHAHALADVKSAHEQGTVAMVGVFIDTFVVLTLTALIVISTLYAGGGVLSAGAVEGVDKSNMLRLGIATLFNGSDVGNMISAIFVAVCLTFFAFSTIISWNMFGKINFNYLFGKKATIVYSILSIAFIFLGSILSNDIVWELADLFNYLMVIPNVLALVALSNVVVSEVKARKKKKLDNNETTENKAQNDSEPLENQQ